METRKAMKRYFGGKYIIKIHTHTDVCRVIKEISFDNLYDAIDRARRFTFSDCEAIRGGAGKSVDFYDIQVVMEKDCFGYDCRIIVKEEETYPTILYFSVLKP